jgi:hypothetical protein
MAAKIITWDWKEQPDLAELAAAVAEMSGGRVHMREVDTGSDQYEWIISDYEVDDAEAERIDAASSTSAEELADQDTPARPYYVNLGVTDDQVARGGDFGCYDFPNLGSPGPDHDNIREW